MAKQLNVDLRFNADVSAAKAQLQSLQTSINQLTTSMATQGAQLGITPKIQEAQQAAVQLKTALSQSMNVETGKFDLSKFNSSLKSMNTDLGKLKTQLVNLGPSGQQTFMTLAQSIMTAEIPTKRISASLATLGTTLKNTAKWQLSSSMLHGFMSAVQTSYRYAQDLNTSLNSIRIVTGESAEAMDKFAARANKAAKQLSASTLDYTDAALIYYQQGLDAKQVEERTNVTIKMANVSRQSAEIVSDQMTAVWNNFYDGSQSLESFADKMVALGAATASSSDEIAGGLEKFAAIGESIGLSFDYASAALATITSNTRQSEEVVGTSLKTIFARIQGLKLGETLEDGVELNKYSEALKTIGVDILDANGELIKADEILDRTAAKWGILTDAQKAATAQTVAGIRQYNQFIALMDNWNSKDANDKDSMMANLETINNSTGALQEQADTYAESWEAASKRAKAAAEELYMSLLDDDFFIGLTNGFADFLGLLDNFIDAMGGAKGLLSGLSSILLHMFAGPAAKGLENMVYNFRSFVGLAEKEAMSTKQRVMSEVRGIVTSTSSSGKTQQQGAYLTGMEGQLTLQESLLGVQDKLNDSEKLQAKYIMEQNAAYAHQVELLGLAADKAKDKAKNAEDKFVKNIDKASLNSNFGEQYSNKISVIGNAEDVVANMRQMYFGTDNSIDNAIGATSIKEFKFDQERTDSSKMTAAIDKYVQELTEAAQELEGIDAESQLAQKMREYANTLDERKKALINSDGTNKPGANEGFENIIKDIQDDAGGNQRKFDLMREQTVTDYGKNKTRIDVEDLEGQDLEEANKLNRKLSDSVDDVVTSFKEEAKTSKKASEGIENLGKNTKDSEKQIKGLGKTTQKWSQTMVGVAQGAMSLSFAISSLNSLKTTWADETIGTGEKLLQTFMSLGMAIPMVINGINGLKTSIMGSNTIQTLAIGLMQTRVALEKEDLTTLTAKQIAKKTGLSLDQAEILLSQMKNQAILQEIMGNSALSKEEMAQMAIQKMGLTADQAEVLMSKIKGKTTLAEALAEMGLTTAKGTGTLATIASTIANWGWLASMSPILAITLVLIAALAGLALIIWGVTAAFKAIVNSTPEAKLKAAKEESQALSEQLNKAKEEADNLKAAFDDYDEVAKKLSECTKGTEEWNNALQENNNKVLELIDQYPKLLSFAGGISIGKDGELIISKDARKGLIKEANERVATAQHADVMGKQKVRDMEIAQLETKRRQQRSMYVMGDELDTGAKTIYDAAAKKYGSSNLGVDEINSIITELKTQGKLQGMDSSQLRDSAMELVETENDLIAAVKENTIATQAETAADGAAIMAGNEEYEKSEYKGLIATIVGANGFNQDSITIGDKTFEATGDQGAEQVLANDYKNRIANSNWWSFGAHATKDANAVFDEYLQYMNMDRSNMENIDFTGDAVYYNAIDPTTGEVSDKKTKIDFDTIANTLAADAAKGSAIEYGETISKQMNSFENKDQAEIFAATASGNSGLLSEELLNKNEEQINEIIKSMEISDEALKELGFSAEEYGGNIEEARADFAKFEKEIVKQEKAYRELKTNGVATVTAIADKAEGSTEKIAQFSADLGKSLGIENLAPLSQEFIEQNEGLITDYINGVEGKAEELRKTIALNEIKVTMGLDSSKIQTELNGEMISLQDLINNFPLEDIEVGAQLNDSGYYDALQAMLDSGQVTADQMNGILGLIGYSPTIEWKELKFDNPVHDKNTNTWTVEYIDPNTGETQTKTLTADQYTEANSTGVVKIPIINGDKTTFRGSPGSSAISSGSGSGNSNGSGSGDGGGGSGGSGSGKSSSPAKKQKLTKKSDIVERHHHVNKALEAQDNILNKLNKKLDRLYGIARIRQMQKVIEALRERNKIEEQWYLKDAKVYEAADKQSLIDFYNNSLKGKYTDVNGEFIEIQFSANGSISNLEQIQESIFKVINYYETELNNKTTQEEQDTYTKDYLDPFNEIKDDFSYFVEQYYESMQNRIDKEIQSEDTKIEIQDLIIERIKSNIELKIEVEDTALEVLDYYISKIEDDTFKAAEAAEYMGEQYGYIFEKAALAGQRYNDIMWEITNNPEFEGDTSLILEEIGETIPELISSLQEMQDLDREMMEYYGEFLSNAYDEFAKYNDILNSGIDKLETYKNLLSLTRREMNYDAMGEVLDGQLSAIKNSVASNKAYFDFMDSEYTALYDRWINEKDSLDKKELEMLEQKLYDAKVARDEAEAEWLSSLEQQGEIAQEILDNNLAKARKSVENFLLKDLFDTVKEVNQNLHLQTLEDYIQEIDRLSAKQENYLTKTNQLYETNKLINQAQMEIDKTSNKQAKQSYQDYMKYIEQLQKQGQMSQQDLAIAQAKFELLQAEIALKEAQEAKDTVRLTRDNEGNYGYVYTANQDKVANAEQNYADKENALYNIGLEGIQNYQSQYAQIMQEAFDTFENINEMYKTGQITTEEEYNQRMVEAKQYYYEILKGYDIEYNNALDLIMETSSTNRADYIQMDMINLETFEEAVDTYLEDAGDSFEEYDKNVDDVSKAVGEDLKDIKTKTGGVETESKNLATTIKNELIPKLQDEALEVREVTSKWGAQRDMIWKNIEAYETLITKLQTLQSILNGKEFDDYSLEMAKHIAGDGSVNDPVYKELEAGRAEKKKRNNITPNQKEDEDFQRLMQIYENEGDQNIVDYVESVINSEEPVWDRQKISALLEDYDVRNTEDWMGQIQNDIMSGKSLEELGKKVDARDKKLGYEGKEATTWQEVLDWSYEQNWMDIIQQDLLNGVSMDDLQTKMFFRDEKLKHEGKEATTQEDLNKWIGEQDWSQKIIDALNSGANNETISAYAKLRDLQQQIKGEVADSQTIIDDWKAKKEEEKRKEEEKAKGVGDGSFSYPLAKKARVTSGYGNRICPYHGAEFHGGIDLGANYDQVLAAQSGIVTTASSTKANGNYIVIDHQNGFETYYLHLSEFKVKKGDKVNEGQTIAISGSTGNSTGPHLDFRIKKNGKYVDPNNYIAFDTGGYTGDWGPEGRMAMLHEKELVLNKQDTENFLTATQMLREISQILDNNALIASLGMINLSAMTIGTPADQVLQQEVTIHADFPNVTDHNEIEIAIDNLINAASQHAYKM